MTVKEKCPKCKRMVEIEAGDWRALRDLLVKGCEDCQRTLATNAPPP